MADIEVKVPDIGDFKDVPIIDVLVRPGDRVKAEDSLITLESDKASMDVPSPLDGVVKEIKVKVGDKVSEGSLILIAEAEVAPAGVAPREKVREGGHATGEGAPVADYGAASGVYAAIEVRVPDIGDFEDVPVIDVAVKSGDQVKPEDPLITLESDKASMDVPSPAAGTVKEVNVKVGDKVSEGSLILTLTTGVAAAAPGPAARQGPQAAPPTAPMAARHDGAADLECDMLVLGAGPGGYSAAFRSADLGMSTVLVERYPTLGGVCLNVGCIPSKALLHTAAVIDEVREMAAHGISYSRPQIDLDKLRSHKERVVGRLTGDWPAWPRPAKSLSWKGSAASSIRIIWRWCRRTAPAARSLSSTGQSSLRDRRRLSCPSSPMMHASLIPQGPWSSGSCPNPCW